jgi:hypothetical protein
MNQSTVSDRAFEDGRTRNVRETSLNDSQGRELPLWDRILRSLEEDLAERRTKKVFVRVRDGSSSYEKEIGELSAEELRGLDDELHRQVAEQLLDRYLAEEGYVDLVEKRRAYTKRIWDLTPEDLPAVVEADRVKAEEYRREREQARFVNAVREDLDRIDVARDSRSLQEAGIGTVKGGFAMKDR